MSNELHQPRYSGNKSRRRKINIWMVIGVVVLVLLLIFWLTWADLLGDTDVAAYVPPFSI